MPCPCAVSNNTSLLFFFFSGELGENCTHDVGACRPSHSSCQYVGNHGYLCECDYQYYPDNGGHCIPVSSPFFTTTIIVSICILFAAVAIGVVMQIRNNMQRWGSRTKS